MAFETYSKIVNDASDWNYDVFESISNDWEIFHVDSCQFWWMSIFKQICVVHVPVFCSSNENSSWNVLISVITKQIEQIEWVWRKFLDQVNCSYCSSIKIKLKFIICCFNLNQLSQYILIIGIFHKFSWELKS